jgi:hypothetical protein
LVLGITIGLVAFGSITISVYLKHQAPLIAAIVLIPKGVLIALCLWFAIKSTRRRAFRLLAVALSFFLIVDHAAMQFQNLFAIRPMPVGWISEVTKRPEATFAVSWIPSSIRGFTKNWVIGIQPGLERRIIERANRGNPPFVEDDLLEVNLKSDEVASYHLLQPDYWLYFATDQKAEFLGHVPTCNRNYSTRVFDNLVLPRDDPQLRSLHLSDKSDVRTIVGELNVTGRAIDAIEIRDGSKLLTRIGIECDDNKFAGELPPPVYPTSDQLEVTIDAVNHQGDRHRLRSVDISSLSPPPALPGLVARYQPSAEALADLNRVFPVAAIGPGYVLFDLRSVWKTSSSTIQK